MLSESTKTQFESFLRQAAEQQNKTDWDAVLEQWKKDVNSLYESVEGILKKYVEKKLILCCRKEISLVEEALGAYVIDQMELHMGSHIVRLIPKGRIIIGARGRVDVVSGGRICKLVLVPEDVQTYKLRVSTFHGRHTEQTDKTPISLTSEEQCVWKIATPPPQITYKELNENNLIELLMELIGERAVSD